MTDDLNETSKNILHAWGQKHKNGNYCDNKLFKDPLLLIEWNDAGILARTAINPQFTKMALINCMYIILHSLRTYCAKHYIKPDLF